MGSALISVRSAAACPLPACIDGSMRMQAAALKRLILQRGSKSLGAASCGMSGRLHARMCRSVAAHPPNAALVQLVWLARIAGEDARV